MKDLTGLDTVVKILSVLRGLFIWLTHHGTLTESIVTGLHNIFLLMYDEGKMIDAEATPDSIINLNRPINSLN